MVAQTRYIRTSDYGYHKDEILVGTINREMASQQEAIRSEVCRLPGVAGASFSQFVISSGDTYMGWGRGEGERYMQYDCLPVDRHYLSTLGIRITEGRDFKAGDTGCLIFNEAARRKYRWLRTDERPTGPDDYLCVGFCENIRYSSFRNNDAATPLAFCIGRKPLQPNCLNVRVQKGTDKVALLHTLQQVVGKFSPGYDCHFRFMRTPSTASRPNEVPRCLPCRTTPAGQAAIRVRPHGWFLIYFHYLCSRKTKTRRNDMELPKDPMMLFSVINMKLRDAYPSLDALCDDLQVSKKDIIDRLKAVGFEYNPAQNKFW